MARPSSTHPTDGELEILQVFWQKGDCTVRDVHDALNAKRDLSFTTVATMVRIMLQKGYLSMVDERRPQVFAAKITRDRTISGMLKDIRKKLLGGSVKKLVMHALADASSSKADLDEIEKMLDKYRVD